MRLLSALLIFGFVFTLPPPANPQAETIKVESSEVLVDAIVTDRHNRIVPNLTAEEFTVYEDGVAQKISSFHVHRGTPAPAREPDAHDATPSSDVRTVAPPAEPPVLTIFLLDYSTTEVQNQKLVQDATSKYVREKMQPNERVAVFSLGSSLRFLTDFTNDRDTLLAALKTGDVRGSGIAADRADLNAEIGKGMSMPVGAPEASVAAGAAAASPGPGMGATGSAAAEAMALQRIAAQYAALRSAMDRQQTREIFTAIRAVALGVRNIQGRKSLLLFSQGFIIPQILWSEMRSVVDAANRSQLAIYSIDARGLYTRPVTNSLVPRDELTAALGPSENEHNALAQQDRIRATGGENMFDRVSQVGHDLPESALRFMAESTGGFLIHNTNDLAIGLARVSEEMRTYYVLSYRSSNQNFDGKFRQVRVEVRVPQLTVRARTGYYAIPAGFELLSPEQYQEIAEWRTAEPAARMPLYLRAGAFREPGNEYRVPVVLEIPTAAVHFEKNGGTNRARFRIVGLVRDVRNTAVMRFGGDTQFDATDAEYNVLKPGDVSFVNTLHLPSGGSYSFEVFVKDLVSGKISRAASGLYLRPADPGLALSTILLARDVEKAGRDTGQFLSAAGVKILPSARCEFRNRDKLIFYLDVYNPSEQPDKKTDLSLDVSILKGGEPVNLRVPEYHVSQPVAQPVPHVTVARYIELTGLAPGEYSLVVSVKDRMTARRLGARAEFTVAD